MEGKWNVITVLGRFAKSSALLIVLFVGGLRREGYVLLILTVGGEYLRARLNVF